MKKTVLALLLLVLMLPVCVSAQTETAIAKGFGGVRAEVADALAQCPKNDPHGKKQLETALVGLDTIRAIQLKFAEKQEDALKMKDENGILSKAYQKR